VPSSMPPTCFTWTVTSTRWRWCFGSVLSGSASEALTGVPIRCVYADLDGTLLGHGGSLLRDAEGGFTLMPVRALEACHRAGVEVVLKSGRRKAQVAEDARNLLGRLALRDG